MPDKIDTLEYESLASDTGVYGGVDMDILRETISAWKASPGDPYTMLELRDGKTLAAFAIVSRTNGREATFDIRYLALDRDYRSSEAGARILDMIEEDLLKKYSYAVIRLETSGKKITNLGLSRYESAGYKIIGHLSGYYGDDNDYYYLVKTIYRNPPNFHTPSPPTGETA